MDRKLKYCGETMELSLLPVQCVQGTGVKPQQKKSGSYAQKSRKDMPFNERL